MMPYTPKQQYPIPRSPRYQTLNAWRGAACLMVVIYHAMFITYATRTEATSHLASQLVTMTHAFNAGVPMFFVISGYCIAAAADSARRRKRSVRSYFTRRFRRIFPPLWIAMGAGIALFLSLDSFLFPGILSSPPWPQLRPWWFSGWQWGGNLTLTETWRYYLIGNQHGFFLQQSWTLCYEEQFYALTGLMLLVAPRRFFAAGLTLTTAVVLIMIFCRWHHVTTAGFFFDGSWMTFAAGMLVYYRINYAGWVLGGCLNSALAAAAILGAYGIFPVPGGVIAFPFALLLSAAHRFDNLTAGATALAPLTFCGRICYSLYLVHQLPVKAISTGLYRAGVASDQATLLLTVPTCIAVSVTLSWLFYHLVERRFLNIPKPVLDDVGLRMAPAYSGENR